ncbi:unnamed protein product [Callosobruchus maculatus]|uniref:Uncharacterized protein n=1 Tax=Callosobruchus maculatus TaxID=64391 RepID=A0A653CX45_CALMS|nr:unnamed protein product [Callosobruchus maculatus]
MTFLFFFLVNVGWKNENFCWKNISILLVRHVSTALNSPTRVNKWRTKFPVLTTDGRI